MKMKSFAMLATSSLIAAAFTYAVPAMADDMSNGLTTQQDTTTDSNSTPTAGTDMQSSSTATPSDTAGSTTTGISTGSGTTNSSTEEGSPDTATGDDDY